MSADFRKLLADAKLPERTVALCLRADLLAEHEAAERDLKEAQAHTSADSLERGGVGALVERIEALQVEMREHSYDFRLRALPRHQFRELVNAHPPRRDDNNDPVQEDAALGVNREAFYPALIHAATIDPVLDEAEWADLLDSKLTDYQFQELAWTAWALNTGSVDVPFSRAASLAKQATGSE